MNLLALETSTESGTCALWLNGHLLERACPAGRPHSETLLPLVRELLAEAGIGFAGLDGIAFGCGPGAFTGLRIACGVAQGLAVAAALPVLPVVGLAAMAETSGAAQVLALLDARMNEVYCARYRRGPDGLPVLDGVILVAAPADIDLPGGPGWVACGNAAAAYPVLAERLRGAGIPLLGDILPGASAVARIGAAALARGEGIDAALAAPLYVRDKVARTVAERLLEGGRA